jgi:two-component system, NtrC family, sensor kinase
MQRLHGVPIQRKLRFVILATCTVALCVASSALFALQYFFFQRDYRRELESVARIIENLSGPVIALGQAEAISEFLNALDAKPHIVGAFVRLSDGTTAAAFGHLDRELTRHPPSTDGFHNVRGDLIYVHPILDERQRLGTLYLLSDYRERSTKLHGLYASILIAVLASSFLVAVVVSSRLERVICGPIQALADTARRIAKGGDYSLRATKEADDEVGEFTDTFNGMLAQIQSRDRELQSTQQQLMDASRQAGMAEVATGVLHNVGNVLNSVNVSATLLAEKLGSSRAENLVRAARLLREQNGTLAEFLTEDTKGRLLPGYLADASDELARERQDALAEVTLLNKNIEHIKDIVAMQQNYARVSGLIETLPLEALIEDAVRMNVGAFERHRITLVRDYASVPHAAVDKHKVLQILVNLLRNAKYALDEGGADEKKLTIRLRRKDARTLAIDVTDNGVGIPAENLTRIFSHGFTTRKEGHGFGLHSAALAAQQMGGSLTAHSGGPGLGATFTLELLIAPQPGEAPVSALSAAAP